jgi:hypothetical protein
MAGCFGSRHRTAPRLLGSPSNETPGPITRANPTPGNWEHEIVVEKVITGNSGSEQPLCLGGKRHRPPEDCGGPLGYVEFLRAIRDPHHEEHESVLESVGGSFDGETFDLAAVNHDLAALSFERWRVQ